MTKHSFKYRPGEKMNNPKDTLTEHAPVFGVTANGSRLSIIEGVLRISHREHDDLELGLISASDHNDVYVKFASSSRILLGSNVLRVVAEMVDHLNEQVKS